MAPSLLFIHVHMFCVFAVIKQEGMQPVELESTEAKEQMHCKSPPFNNRVSTITTVIKSEMRHTEAPRNSVPVVMAPSAVAKQETDRVDEAERAVVKSIQQAKIPLKKRELKLAESYHSNHHTSSNSSRIIVCNPSVTQTRARDGNGSEPAVAAHMSSQHQQALVTTLRQELTSGRPPLQTLPPRQGQNGVPGLVGHVGVICSPPEHHRALSGRPEEQNRPCSDSQSSRGVEDERETRRQTVLVRKEEFVALTAAHIDVNQPEITEKQLDSVDASSLKHSPVVTNQQTDPLDAWKTSEPSSHQQKAHIQASEEPQVEPARADTPIKLEPQKDHEEEEARAADTCGLESEEKRWPPDKAFSELQKEGIRLKIKIPPQRRNKLKGKGDKQERDSKQDVQDESTPLRRSARICRCV